MKIMKTLSPLAAGALASFATLVAFLVLSLTVQSAEPQIGLVLADEGQGAKEIAVDPTTAIVGQPASPEGVPLSLSEVPVDVASVVNAAKDAPKIAQEVATSVRTGWEQLGIVGAVGVVISWLLTFLRSPLAGSVLGLVAPQYRAYLPVAIGLLTALSAFFSGIVDADTAALIGLSGPTAIAWHELLNESVRGQAKSRRPKKP